MSRREAKNAHDNALNECSIETSFITCCVRKRKFRKTREGITEPVTLDSQLEVCRKEAWENKSYHDRDGKD